MKQSIYGLSFDELLNFVESNGKRSFVAKNIWHWVYKKRIKSFKEMSNVSKELIAKLEERFSFSVLEILTHEKSKVDGTIKFLFKLADGNTIETVFIPQDTRYTLCVSSQVGCKMGCKFCKTGEMGFIRNLETSEIVEQVVFVDNYVRSNNICGLGTRKDKAISNIVYMGMGEPLDNYDNVVKSVNILSDDNALGIGKRKITISTAGLVDKLPYLYKDTGVRIAISLNATNDTDRANIMPVNNSWTISDIVKTIRQLPLKRHEFITIEYVMFSGINDDILHAKELAKLLKGLKVKVNLIPYNSFKGSSFKTPSDKALHDFYDILVKNGLVCNVRYSKGKDISAACGQLKSKAKVVS